MPITALGKTTIRHQINAHDTAFKGVIIGWYKRQFRGLFSIIQAVAKTRRLCVQNGINADNFDTDVPIGPRLG